MEHRINNAKFKLGFLGKKIYVYNRKTNEEVDVIYLDEKINKENAYMFKTECNCWYADNYDVVED